ncbi:MAG TPA: hypothetical protein VNK91_10505 [Burkholderiaceae bacterium]|jgi:hypothetical protein|nr:hypothetical protein [Burkholderiaceae bacterium]
MAHEDATIAPSADPAAMARAESEARAEADRLTAAVLYLLVRTATDGACVQQALAVGQHLEMLAAHPGAAWPLRTTALQLRERWMRYCAQAMAAAHGVRH